MRVAPLPTRITVISGFLPFFFFSFSFFQVDLKVTPTPRRTTVSFHCRLMDRNESAICDGLKKKREWRPLDPLTNVSFSTGTKIYRSCEKRFLKMLNHFLWWYLKIYYYFKIWLIVKVFTNMMIIIYLNIFVHFCSQLNF